MAFGDVAGSATELVIMCRTPESGPALLVDGVAGIVASVFRGAVKAPAVGNGGGINLKVDIAAEKVHVLL